MTPPCELIVVLGQAVTYCPPPYTETYTEMVPVPHSHCWDGSVAVALFPCPPRPTPKPTSKPTPKPTATPVPPGGDGCELVVINGQAVNTCDEPASTPEPTPRATPKPTPGTVPPGGDGCELVVINGQAVNTCDEPASTPEPTPTPTATATATATAVPPGGGGGSGGGGSGGGGSGGGKSACDGVSHEHVVPSTGASACHPRAEDHVCPEGKRLVGHSDCETVARPAKPTELGLSCSDSGDGGYRLSAQWTKSAAAGALHSVMWWKSGQFHSSPGAGDWSSASVRVSEPGDYTVTVSAAVRYNSGAGVVRALLSYQEKATARCGPPAKVTGLKCTAATSDSVTVEWDPAAGAKIYQVAMSHLPRAAGWSNIQSPVSKGNRLSTTTSTWRHATDLYLSVRAVNRFDPGPQADLITCRTPADDWLEVQCSAANAMVHVTWDNLPDNDQVYRVTVAVDGSSSPSWRAKSFSSSTADWVLAGIPEQTYRVDIESTGVPEYSQTKTKKCPKLDPHGRFPTPNLWPQEGGLDWPWERDLDDEYSSFGHPVPFLITGVSGYERACTLLGKTWTCKEHWTEPMKVEIEDAWKDVLIANSIQIVQADGLTDTERTWLSRGLNWSIGRIARVISWSKEKAVRIFVGKTAGKTASELNVGGYFLDMGNDGRMFAYIYGPTCLPNSISKWKPATFIMPEMVADDYISQVGDYTVKRQYTVHYCKETPSS